MASAAEHRADEPDRGETQVMGDAPERRLVMTLLVRDEEDVVCRNLDFHFAQGVDFVIATDNGSKDRTRMLLEEYERRGKLRIIDEAEQNYMQSDWVNRMTRMAVDEYAATAVFHCDADEFWVSRSGDLKKEIHEAAADVLAVPVFNVLLADKQRKESYLTDSAYVVIRPVASQNQMEDMKRVNLYLFPYPDKVIFKTTRGPLDVIMGNHGVLGEELVRDVARDIVIVHYPVRGWKHFLLKVENGGSSYERNKRYGAEIGFQWRWWYRAYRKGTLAREYSRLVVDRSLAMSLYREGIIVGLPEFVGRVAGRSPYGLPGL
jgi:hypothetical protein